MATNYLTPLYGWNEKAGRYYNLTTGNFVPFMDVRNALESNITASQAEMRSLTQQLIDGTISRGDWYVGMERQIRLANVSASAAARGGWAQMTQSDWGAVGQQVRAQYDYLRNFANEIASGKQRLNGSALVRADLYGQAARGNFEEMRRRMAKLEGMTEEMRVLGEADHCDDCLSAAGHWAPIGTLPRIGDSQCVTNCPCTFKYRKGNAGSSSSIPDNASQMDVILHFNEKYNVYLNASSGKSPTVKEAQQIDAVLSRLPEKYVKDNPRFTELEVLADNPALDVRAFHQGNRITLYRKAFSENNAHIFTQNGSSFDEVITHELGESLYKQTTPEFRASWIKTSKKYETEYGLADEPPNEQFSIWFSRLQVGDDIPLEIRKLVE
jgi:hypothetical protein